MPLYIIVNPDVHYSGHEVIKEFFAIDDAEAAKQMPKYGVLFRRVHNPEEEQREYDADAKD